MRFIPRRDRLCGGALDTSLPPSTTDPVHFCTPVMALNVVVLPAPLGPISPTIWPASTVSETSLTAWCCPKWTLIPVASRVGTVHLPTESGRLEGGEELRMLLFLAAVAGA